MNHNCLETFLLILFIGVCVLGVYAIGVVIAIDDETPDDQVFICGKNGGVVYEWRTLSFLKTDDPRPMTFEEYTENCEE